MTLGDTSKQTSDNVGSLRGRAKIQVTLRDRSRQSPASAGVKGSRLRSDYVGMAKVSPHGPGRAGGSGGAPASVPRRSGSILAPFMPGATRACGGSCSFPAESATAWASRGAGVSYEAG
jgi:hypothetical protein